MLEVLQIFSNGNFISHEPWSLWKPSWASLQVASDLIIVLSHFVIPLLLVYFLRRRPDIPFPGILWLFCAFLIACGSTHLMSMWTLWYPFYWLSGLFKIITATVACYTVGQLVQLIPEALALPTATQLEVANQALAAEIQEHRQTETELRESTQRLFLLVEQTPLAVIEWTTNFEVTDWNPAAQKIFGYSKQEALGCQAVELMVPEGVKEQVNQIWQQLLQQQGGTRSTNVNFTKEGQEIYCEWYNTPLIDAGGQVIGVASLVQDITEQKLAVEALQESKNQLEIRVEARTQELKQALAELNEVITQLQCEIDQRQEVEASLREREEQYRSVVDNVKEVIFQTDANGKWTFLNPAWTEITGFAIADSLGTLCLDYVHPDDRPRNLEQFQPLIEHKKEYCNYEVRYLTKSGAFRWIEVLAQLTLDADGKIVGTCGTLNDITERHLIEQARCTREAKLRKQHLALSELAQCQSIYNGDLSIALQEITKTVARTLDIERCSVWLYNDDRSMIECVDLYELTLNCHSASYQLASADYPDYFNALEMQGVIAAADAHTDPRTRDFLASYLNPLGITSILDAPICLGGITVGVLCTEHIGAKRQWSWEEQNFVSTNAYLASLAMEARNRAATERALRQSEEQFRQLTENINEVFFLSTPDLSQVLYISPAYEQVWGRTKTSLYEQPSSWMDSVHPQDRDRVSVAITRHLQQEQDFAEEFRILRPGGSVRWVWMRGFFVRNEAGVATRIAGIAEDITEHKRAQAETLNALLKEKELSDLKSRFVSMTSHEFRTPLTTILSTTELLQYYEWTREEELEQLHLIQEAIKQMLQLLDDALFIGTADAGKLRFNPEPLALNEFCRELVIEIQRGMNLRLTSISPKHTLTFVSPDQNLLACMDKKLLRQLLSNLLLNAIKYSPSGGTVQFRLAYQGDKAVFQIQDQGIGIPKEDQALVFEFFHRAKNVGAIDGTGLGLAIVKKCIDLHGGQVTVDSEVGVGTQFTVLLPLNNPHLPKCQCTEVLAPEKPDL